MPTDKKDYFDDVGWSMPTRKKIEKSTYFWCTHDDFIPIFWRMVESSPRALKLLYVILAEMTKSNFYKCPSTTKTILKSELRMDDAAISRSLTKLREMNLIKGSSKMMMANPAYFWKKDSKTIANLFAIYAKYDGKIDLSKQKTFIDKETGEEIIL